VKPAFVLPIVFALAPGAGRADWPDGYVARLAALARLESLNAELLSHDSATAVLQRFCDTHGAPPGLKIRAHLEPGPAKPADAGVRRDLQAGPDTPLRYRRVALACGDVVLSRADNWYRPDRLSEEMNRRLETTDTPFGVVVAPLNFHRRTLSARLLVEPLPPGWEAQPPQANAAPLILPPQVLEHRAVLTTSDGAPFSLVVETYAEVLIATPAPGDPPAS
jgi:hypothetical protein